MVPVELRGASVVGSQFVFADGTLGGTITARNNATSLTVSTSQTVTSQSYSINYTGLQVLSDGRVGIGTSNPANFLSNIPADATYSNVGDGGATGQTGSSFSWSTAVGGYSAVVLNASNAANANGLHVRTLGTGVQIIF